MANFEKTALYDRIADFISIMDEDELRELAEVCKGKADIMQQDRNEKHRKELMKNLQDDLTAIQRAGFSVEIENTDARDWIIRLLPEDIYSIKMEYVGK